MDHQKYFNVYSIFALVFFFKLLFIFQGIDLIDEGYHLTQQVAAFTDKVDYKEVTAAYFLTQYAGGAWLKIWGAPNLLWARVGGVLIYALNAAIIFQLLSTYFDRKKTFYAVTATALFITMHEFDTIIHYYTLPSLLINTGLLTLSKLIKSNEFTNTTKAYGFLLGFLVVPIILSRLPLVLILLLPAAAATYYKITKTENRQLKKSVPYLLLGLLTAAVIFALFYQHIGFLDYYVKNTQNTLIVAITGSTDLGDFSELHRTDRLVDYYFREYVRSLLGTTAVLVTIFMLVEVLALVGKKRMMYFVGFVLLLFVLGIMQMLGGLGLRLVYYSALLIVNAALFALLLLSAIFLYSDRGKNADRNLLLLCGAFILFITPLGSDIGLVKSVHGMWLIMPLLILGAYEAKEKVTNIKLKSTLSMLDALVWFIIIISVLFQLVNVYMDDANRLNLNTEFAYPPLRGVYSTPERVKVMDEALFKIDEYTEKGDSVLMVTSIPLLYYLTETKPAIGDPWPIFRSVEKIMEDNRDMVNAGRYPKIFVYHKFETLEPTWPNKNITTYVDPRYMGYFKDEYINNLNYTLLWENEAFAIYSKDKL